MREVRKLLVSSFVSLDGVIEAPMSWVGAHFDAECKEYAYNKLANVEFFLLGRLTYEMFSARWPQIKGDKYIDRINGLKKLVVSRTLKNVAWNASLIAGDVAAELATIKKQPGANIMKYGISDLDRTSSRISSSTNIVCGSSLNMWERGSTPSMISIRHC